MYILPILCEENLLEYKECVRIVMHKICVCAKKIGVVFFFKTTKLKKNNIKTCAISSSVYFHTENTLFFSLKPSLFCVMSRVGLLTYVSLCNIFLRFKLPWDACLGDGLWLISDGLHHQTTSVFLLKLYESEKMLWLCQETCLLFLPGL